MNTFLCVLIQNNVIWVHIIYCCSRKTQWICCLEMNWTWYKSRCDCLILSPALQHLDCFIPIVNTSCLVARVHRLAGAELDAMLMPGRASVWAAECQMNSHPFLPVLSQLLLPKLLVFFYNDSLALSALSSVILQLESARADVSQQLLGKQHQVPTRSNTTIFKTPHRHFSFSSALHRSLLFKKALFFFFLLHVLTFLRLFSAV